MLRNLYIITMAYAFTHQFGIVQPPYFIKYIIALFWIIYSYNNLPFYKLIISNVSTVYAKPIFLCIAATATFWLIKTPLCWNFDFLTRFLSNAIVLIITIYAAVSATVIFKEKAIDYSFYGLCLSTFVCVGNCIVTFGFGSFLYVFIHMMQYVEGELWESNRMLHEVGTYLEVHDGTFAFGFYFLYYLIFDQRTPKQKKWLIILTLVGMWLGFKRLQVGALLISYCFYHFFVKRSRLSKSTSTNIIFLGTFICSIIYVWLIKYYPALFLFLDKSRVDLYSFMGDMISFNPFEIGKGFAYVNGYLSWYGSSLAYGTYGQGLLPVSHSELTRMYIELGLPCFFLWLRLYCKSIPQYIQRNISVEAMDIYIIMLIYLMFTYLIDNTMTLFATQFGFYLISSHYIVYNQIKM